MCDIADGKGDSLGAGWNGAFDAFRAGGEVIRWMNVRPALESGRGLAPTTALQDAGARIGKPLAKSATFWSAAMERSGFAAFERL
jgi:hypothetical protein